MPLWLLPVKSGRVFKQCKRNRFRLRRLNEPFGGSEARTTGEFPGRDSLAPLELHGFQPQTGLFTTRHIHVFRRRNDFAWGDASLGCGATFRTPPYVACLPTERRVCPRPRRETAHAVVYLPRSACPIDTAIHFFCNGGV